MRWFSNSLRTTLILGAAIAILLPALVVGYFQIGKPFKSEGERRHNNTPKCFRAACPW